MCRALGGQPPTNGRRIIRSRQEELYNGRDSMCRVGLCNLARTMISDTDSRFPLEAGSQVWHRPHACVVGRRKKLQASGGQTPGSTPFWD